MIRGDVLEVMGLVDDQPLVGGKHRRLIPVVGGLPHGEVGGQQMVIDHHDVGLRRPASRLEHEAAIEVRAPDAGAEVGLGRDLVPDLARRRGRQVRERAVAGVGRPGRDVEQFLQLVGLQQRLLRAGRAVEPRQAEVVAPSLQERVGRDVLVVAQRPAQQRQVLADELLLQVDGVRAHDRPLAVRPGPRQGRDEVGERLPHPGPRLEHQHATLVVRVDEVGREVALALAILVAAQRLRDGSPLAQQRDHVERIDRRAHGRRRHLDDDVEPARCIVHDREAHPVVVEPGRDRQVRARRLEVARGMVVDEQLARLRHPGERKHGVERPARDGPGGGDHPCRVDRRDERDLVAAGRRDLASDHVGRGGGEAIGQVFSSFFFAAGKRTLLRMSR